MKIEINQTDIQTCGLFKEMEYMELRECWKQLRTALIQVDNELKERDKAIGRSTADNWKPVFVSEESLKKSKIETKIELLQIRIDNLFEDYIQSFGREPKEIFMNKETWELLCRDLPFRTLVANIIMSQNQYRGVDVLFDSSMNVGNILLK